jgi:hypothetical protein
MTQPSALLCAVLDSLGQREYVDRLVAYIFTTWESIFYIYEDDFEVLQFKHGHRRMLQHEIATWLHEFSYNTPGALQNSIDARRKRDKGIEDEFVWCEANPHHTQMLLKYSNRSQATFV